MTPVTASITALEQRFADRLFQLEERSRANFAIPAAPHEPPVAARGEWMSAIIRMLSGERIPDLQMRALADLVTTDNVGVVPDAYLTELIGVIDPSRPFLQTTRKLDLPAAGMSLVVPKIVTKPTAGVQAVFGDESYPEKAEITSSATSITNVTYDAVTIAGGGDISLQLLKRSSPSYLGLFLELLAEAYALNAEAEALGTLIALVGAPGGVNDGGTLDPENLILGNAWASGAAVRKPINTMWLSSTAVGAFIDAKATTTNAPLYSSIQAGFTAGGGTGGTISGLRPVWVPALDGKGIDVLVGPSAGFGWTEDGTYTLQVDVPAKAGRDVALVGILWFAPMYPTAFTAYGIAS
jgi:HK97 family phage major capsid protein